MNHLMQSTRLPSVEAMTFADADAEVVALLAAANRKWNKGDEAEREAEFNCAVARELIDAILTTPPRTLADALAMLNRLACEETGLSCAIPGEQTLAAVDLLRDFMAELVEKGGAVPLPPGTPSTTLPPQPPYPLKGFTPQRNLRGWLDAGAPILWREQPGARSLASRYTVMDCTIVGPFFLDVILQDEPDTPEAPFLWSLCRLLGNEFIIRGDEPTLAKAKAAAEEAARVAMAAEPCEPSPAGPETEAPATIGGAVKVFNAGRWGASLEAWTEHANDDRLEADLAILAERFRLALAAAGPLTSMDDALALAALLHEVTEEACNPDCWPLYGARASVVSMIADALAEPARRGLQSAGIVAGMPSLPPTAPK
ncbi:hypothetical protein ABNQ39_11395 [Azospirillum sp. A26]|uniref:hypothetical protein n=1 Tax=Azospirillum sp. A26 TaxID=3160607 RepID=UPI00366BC853